MWNDGYSKEQPWLNYYNSYERMHCCFGDDGSDAGVGGADDEAGNTGTTSLTGAQNAAQSKAAYSEALSGAVGSEYYDEERSSEKSAVGMNAAQAEQVSDAVDRAQREGIAAGLKDSDITEQMQNVAEGGNRGAAAGYEGDELGAVAAANIDEDFFSDKAIGSKTSGYGGFVDPFAFSGYGQTSFASWMDDLPDALSFFGENLGVTSAISAAARALGIAPEEVTQEDINKTQDYSMNRAKESPLEAAAYAAGQRTADPYRDGIAGPTTSPFDDEYYGPAVIDRTGIGAAYAAQPPEDPVAVQRSIGDAMLGVIETRGGPPIDLTDAFLNVGYREEAQKANKAATEQQEAQETGGIADPYEVAYQARQDMSYGQDDPGADFGGFEYGLGADFMPGPGQPGYGGAALGGMTDAELQAAYAEEGRNISSAIQPAVQGLRSVDSGDPEKIIKPSLPVKEAEVVPKTPMEKYFAERGTPAIPSSFQEYRSYLPPIGPAANADYRRTLALGTPRYQEPSRQAGEPFNYSAATLSATYGIPYKIALERLRSQNATAMGGGGLRSLMEYS